MPKASSVNCILLLLMPGGIEYVSITKLASYMPTCKSRSRSIVDSWSWPSGRPVNDATTTAN